MVVTLTFHNALVTMLGIHFKGVLAPSFRGPSRLMAVQAMPNRHIGVLAPVIAATNFANLEGQCSNSSPGFLYPAHVSP